MKAVFNTFSKYLSASLLLVFAFSAINAQPMFDDRGFDEKTNFYELKKSFNEHWKDKDITEKGKGWKPFKRWEWFWEQRVHPTGEFPSTMQNMIEFRKMKSKKSKIEGTQAVGSWTALGPNTNGGGYGGLGRVNVVREDPANSSVIWAGSAGGGLWKSTNSGSTWTTNTDNLGVLGVTDIAFHPTNSQTMFIATGDGDAADNYSIGVLKSTDAGATWNTTGLTWNVSSQRRISRLLINPSNPSIMLVASSAGIFRTTDGGTTWTQPNTSNYRDMEFKPNDPSVIYAGRYGSPQIMKSTDNGATWTAMSGLPTTGVNRVALAVTPANANYIYALMSKSSDSGFYGLYRSTDAGATWSLMSSTPNILGWNTNGSDAGGQGWYDLCIAANPNNANEIYTGGVNLWKSTNGGTNWINLSSWTSSVHADQHDIWINPNGTKIYVGNDGGVYSSTNSGTNWSWIGSGLQISQLYRLGNSKTNANLVITGLQDNGTKLRNNTTWTDVVGGDGMECMIDHSNSNIMYGALYYGQIRKSTNGGSSFSSMTLPSEYSSNLGAWVTPYIMHPTTASTIYVGYRNVFKSTNSGSTWTQISSFTSGSLTLLHVAPSDANYIYASTGSSALNRTTDGGTTWSSLTLPTSNYFTYLAIHPTNPLKIWATFSGYTANAKVYESTNGGSTWTNISGTGQLPNVPANTIVYQNDYQNRLYVGTDIGVYYKDDNSNGWVEFSDNLPNVVVNELEIHYGTMKLRAATYGRGLWEAEIPVAGITLETPTLSLPTNSSTNVTISPTLSWTAVTDATSYNVQYSTNADLSGATQVNVATTSLNLSGLSQFTTYYWRVQAKNESGVSNWTSAWNFKTELQSLAAPVLSSPANSATGVAVSTTLSWQAVANATSYIVEYSSNSDFSSAVSAEVTSTSKAISGLSYLTQYYWRVQAKNASILSNWSSRTFTTVQLTLSTPSLSSPSNRATNVSLTPTLSWGSVANATSYNVQYATNSSFTDATLVNVSSTSTSLSGLSYTTRYYWRVQAKNGNSVSSWSSSRYFNTLTYTLSAPTLSSPANNATNVSRSPLFIWNSVNDATSYDLQYSRYSNFSSATTVSDIASTSQSATGLLSSTTYYWRVRAKNALATSSWSSSRKFKTGTSGKFSIEDENLAGNSYADLKFYPNPLSNKANFKLEVVEAENITIEITDINGNRIALLLNEYKVPGMYEFDFDASKLSSGTYYCNMIISGEIISKPMMIVK